jgi:hypothetical protein
MAACASDGLSASGDHFAALQRNSEWQKRLQPTALSDHEVEEAFAFVCKYEWGNVGSRSTLDIDSPDEMELLQQDAALGELLCSAGAPQTNKNIDAAFRLLRARPRRMPTTRDPSPPLLSPSHSECESTEANNEGVSSSSYAVPHFTTTRRTNPEACALSDEAIPHDLHEEAHDSFELGMNAAFLQ